MVYDEVMCGMGRTGTYHAWQSLGGVAPDLQSIGKGLGAGYQPISAVLIGEKVYQMFEKHSKGAHKFVSGHTFQGHSAGCACALTVQTILKRDDLLTNVKEMGELLRSTLRNKLPVELFSHGASVRGLGLLIGVDFGATGEQYGGPLCAQVLQEAYKLGLAVYPCSSSVDAILLAPPFIINAQQVEFLARTLTQALRTVLAERGHKTAAKI
jgi:adenosylmethionine-8-amino-7-oxononanoate aminotransferase